MGLNLFEGAGSDDEDISKIEINKEFARRFEHNKKREDLRRLEELNKKGLVEGSADSSPDSEEEEEDDSSRRDLQFFDALIKVKKKDPIIMQKDAKLFESESEDEDEEEEEEVKEKDKKLKLSKKKPMYLKDVVAKHLIEEGPEFEDGASKSGVKSYFEEQEELKQAFFSVAEEAFDDDEGDLLTEKKKTMGDDDEQGENVVIQKKVDEYFGKDEKLDGKEMFLKDYFSNKMWIDKDKGEKPLNDDLVRVLEDEEELEKQGKYEAEYNFRFEEGAGDRVMGHSRFTEGSVRKKTNARKVQRQSKEERMALAEFERREELKHLKNLKKKEILEKLEKIRTIAGITGDGAYPLNEGDLEEDFDPEEYDRKMKETFDADYYNAEDADPEFCSDKDEDGFEIEKPDFDKEDELLGLPKSWDVGGSGNGFAAVRERVLKHKASSKNVGQSDGHDLEEEELSKEGKRKRKRKISLKEKVAFDKELEEYYKLDYEDTIGDLKTRFKYTSVPAKRYGLSAEEILMIDDKDLNQYVSLKKLAPYREKEWKVNKKMKYNQIMKKNLILPRGKLASKKHSLKDHGQKTDLVTGDMEQRNMPVVEVNGEAGSTSRKSRRRHRLAELKLSQSRLMAYGKIPPKTKSRKGH